MVLSSSSDEEDSIADNSHDFEFTQWLYGELNRDLLGPPGDDKVIILSDSNEEKEEVRKEKSAAVNPTSTASAGDTSTPVEKSSTLAASPANADDDPGVEPNEY
jgi:hypothetical protein